MGSQRKKLLSLSIAVALLLFARVSAFAEGPVPVGQQVPRFDIKDINGRFIPADQLKGWIVVYGIGNEDTADKGLEWIRELTRANPDAKGVVYIVIADVHNRDSKILRPLVKKILKKEYRKNINALQKEFDEKGIKLDHPVEDNYFVVADFKSDIMKLFGVADMMQKPHGFLMDGTHTVRGYFTSYSDEIPKTFTALLAERDAQKQYAMKSQEIKGDTKIAKYLLIGALGWLATRKY